MSYIKYNHHKSFIIKNTSNNSSAEFFLFTQSIVHPKNRQVFAIDIATNFNHNSKENINTEEFFNTISDDFFKELISIQVEELNINKEKINSKGIIASINCPFNLLSDNDFIKKIVSLSKVNIALEITDFKNGVITDSIKKSIEILKSKGHELWLDDFMSEDIPINVLHMLNWDRVKIDKTFIYQNLNNISIMSALHHHVSNNSLKAMIFKGIESDYQHDEISKLNCLCQGFLYRPPFTLGNISELSHKLENTF